MPASQVPQMNPFNGKFRATQTDINNAHAPALFYRGLRHPQVHSASQSGFNRKRAPLLEETPDARDGLRPASSATLSGLSEDRFTASSSGLTISSTTEERVGAKVLLPAPLGPAISHSQGLIVMLTAVL